MKVSVVIPLYNHEAYIAQALRSVLNQDLFHSELEIVIVDDGSVDESANRVEPFLSDSRIRYFYQKNQGAHIAINNGIKYTVGDIVCILNSDDYYLPGRIAALLDRFSRYQDVGAVFTGIVPVDQNGSESKGDWYAWYCESVRYWKDMKRLRPALLNANFLATTSNLAIRRSCLERVGAFNNLRYAHDLDFFLRLLSRDVRIDIIDEPLLGYRIHAGNTIKEDGRRVRLEWAAVVAVSRIEYSCTHPLVRQEDVDEETIISEILRKHGLEGLVAVYSRIFLSGPSVDSSFNRIISDMDLSDYLLSQAL